MRPIRSLEGPLRSLTHQAGQSWRVPLEDLEARDEAHDSKKLVVEARGQLPIIAVPWQREVLFGQEAELGTTRPSRARLAPVRGEEGIFNRGGEAPEEAAGVSTPEL